MCALTLIRCEIGTAGDISCDSDLNLCQQFEYLVSILSHNAGVELCLQQKHHQSLWTDSKSLPPWSIQNNSLLQENKPAIPCRIDLVLTL